MISVSVVYGYCIKGKYQHPSYHHNSADVINSIHSTLLHFLSLDTFSQAQNILRLSFRFKCNPAKPIKSILTPLTTTLPSPRDSYAGTYLLVELPPPYIHSPLNT